MKSLFITLLFITNLSLAQNQANLQLLQLGHKIIQVEIADTLNARNRGLMHRKSLPKNQGMLFVFPTEEHLSFWMKNTHIPLSIGFFNSKKELLEVQEMKPESVLVLDLVTYKSSRPAQYALEMNKGWFSKNKIKLGTKFRYIKSKTTNVEKKIDGNASHLEKNK